jgi:DNA modification methylase
MEINKIYNEPCLETLKRMPDNFIDCVITSPPYWQLRDYGYDGQWGLEPTFQEYLENLWYMMDEVYRVLKPTGTAWINLGDSYSTQSGTNVAISRGTHTTQDATYLVNRGESGKLIKDKSLPNKCLLLLPHRFAIGCIDRGWIVRNDIIWAKRNGMPESVTDRFSKKHEYFFFMTKQEKYYFDLDGIRDKLVNSPLVRNKSSEIYGRDSGSQQFSEGYRVWGDEVKGKNPGTVSDFWDIPTKPSNDAHYAKYNDELLKKPVIAGCPEGGLIYDPFMGSGTTAKMALRTNRNFIGSEMGEDYVKISDKGLIPQRTQTKLF